MEVSLGLGTKQRLCPIQNALEARCTVSAFVSVVEASPGCSTFFDHELRFSSLDTSTHVPVWASPTINLNYFREVTDGKGSTFPSIC